MTNPFEVRDEPAETNRKRTVANERLADDEFLRSALRSRAGRKYFWRLLERCHIFETSYVQGSFDGTAFREGERNFGQRLLADIMRVAPESYLEMTNEQKAPAPVEKENEDA